MEMGEKVALETMGSVCICSKAKAIRILQGKEEGDWKYNHYHITDLDDGATAQLVKDLRETPKQKIARRVKAGFLTLTANFTDTDCMFCKDMLNPIFKNDGECTCGINKHHYHCSSCGCLTQIG